MGTQGGGLNRFDSTTGRFSSYLNEPSLTSDECALVRGSSRNAVGGYGRSRLITLRPREREQVTSYRHNSEDPQSLSNNKVNAIREDRHGRLWIGTESGLNLLDRNRGTVTIFTTNEGLPDNVIESILEDRHGYLWLGTHNGLSRFDPQTRTFRNYSESDGAGRQFTGPVRSRSAAARLRTVR